MKRILLTSTALVAFAGAAAAEIKFSGDAKVGYNTLNGAYWGAGLDLEASQELNGGLTAGLKTGVDFASGAAPKLASTELYLKSDSYGMYFGQTKTATEAKWSNVSGMTEAFAKKLKSGEVAVLRGEGKVAGFDFALSAGYVEAAKKFQGYQLAAKYTAGAYNFGLAWQDKDAMGGSKFGVSVGGSFSGADVTLAHVRAATGNTSTGVSVAYPFGPVKASAYYASNSAAPNAYGLKLEYAQDAIKVTAKYDVKLGTSNVFALDGSYDLGNGLVLKAGGSSDNKAYIGGEYDLGNGAALLVSHGYNGAAGIQKDIGAPKYKEGTTVQVSFKF